MKTRLLSLLLVASLANVSQAQTLSDLRGYLTTICGAGGSFNIDLQFACTAAEIVSKGEGIIDSLNGDLLGLGRELGMDFLTKGLSQLGQILPAGDINAFLSEVDARLQDIDNNVPDSLTALVATIDKAVDDSTKLAWDRYRNRRDAPPAGSPEGIFNRTLLQNPLLQLATLDNLSAQATATKQLARIRTQDEATSQIAKQYSEDTALEDLSAAVLRPGIPRVPKSGGLAASIKESGSEATSTRGAVQVMIEAQADDLAQSAVVGTAIVDGLKTLVQQSAITNDRLNAEVKARYEEVQAKLAARQRELKEKIVSANLEAQETAASLKDLFHGIADSVDPNASKLDVTSLGW